MKMGFKKVLASVMAAIMAVSVPVTPAQAAPDAADGTIYSSETVISLGDIGNERLTKINDGWKFFLGASTSAQDEEFDDSSWRDITLPHDYSIEQEFTTKGEAESGYLLGGTGWYRKSFTMSAAQEGKRVSIEFGGVYMNATVYINGQKLGIHPYGYTGFAFDLTDYLVYDGMTQNVIAVKVDHKIPSSRWYSGSGIYRDVYLKVTDEIHIARRGTTITTPNLPTQKNGQVDTEIATEVFNESNSLSTVSVRNTIYNGDTVVGSATSNPVSVAAGATVSVANTVQVATPVLWSVDNPHLYEVETEIIKDGMAVDTSTEDFGYTYSETKRTSGFYLNGEPLKLKGVCMHHDQGALGAAAYADAVERQVRILKEMGCNAIRVTHNPAGDVLIDACNRLGMLIIDEAFDTWLRPKNGNTYDYSQHFQSLIEADNAIIGGDVNMTWAEYDIKEMVGRDKNSPCVIMYSLGNEIFEGINTSNAGAVYLEAAGNLIDWVKEVDPTRPVTFGDNKLKSNWSEANAIADLITEEGGVVGLNYCGSGLYSSLYNNHQNWTIYGSETASAIGSRGIYTTLGQDSTQKLLTAYDKTAVGWGATASSAWYDVIRNDTVAGTFVWTGFDYIGEPTPWNGTGTGSASGIGAAPNSSFFGIIDTAGLPKDDYYFYQAMWNDDVNTLHVLPCWDRDSIVVDANGNVEVVVYSDAPTVKLFLNGREIAISTSTQINTNGGYSYRLYQNGTAAKNLYSTFSVPFEEGTLTAKAYDANGTEVTNTVGRNTVSTSGAPTKLKLTAENTEIEADGQSLAYFTVDVTDANGNLDPNASDEITFTLEGAGEIVGVDNGKQTDMDSYQADSPTVATRQVFTGKAIVIVRATDQPGAITITATAAGKQSDSVTIQSRGEEISGNAVVSYQMPQHCYIPEGSNSVTLPQTALVTYMNGTSTTETISWDAFDSSRLESVNNFKVGGSFGVNGQVVNVQVTVHVTGTIVCGLNYSGITQPNTVPLLPAVVPTILDDGTIYDEYSVTWDQVNASQFANVGDIVTINGTVSALGSSYPVKATIRVAEVEYGEESNIAPDYLELTESCSPTSDNLLAIADGFIDNAGNTPTARWTNWNTMSTPDAPVITFTWATIHMINSVNMYYFNDNTASHSYPTKVTFEYSNDNHNWQEIGYEPTEIISYTDGPTVYNFNQSINPIALRVTMEHTLNKFVGLAEMEILSTATYYSSNSTANLESISVDGNPLSTFDSNVYLYTVEGETVTAASARDNAAVTVVPVADGAVIICRSEDQSTQKIYRVNFGESAAAASATMTASALTGNTGDTIQLGFTALDATGADVTGGCFAEYHVSGPGTCDSKGKLILTGAGTVEVSATVTQISDNSTVETDTITIQVSDQGQVEDLVPITEGLSATAGSSQNTYGPENAIDGDTTTHWHTAWTTNNVNISGNTNNEFTIDLGATYKVGKLTYLPRQGNADGAENGRILGFDLYYSTSETGNDFTKIDIAPVDSRWADNTLQKEISFDAIDMRRIQIRATATAGAGNQANLFVSAAEFNVYKLDETTPPPVTFYTITFDANDGSVLEKTRIVKEAEALGELPVPTRSGYEFNGWYTEATGGTKITATTVPTASVTYHAQWTEKPVEPEPDTYRISFGANGGTITITGKDVVRGEAVGELPEPTRSGFTFKGWFTAVVGGTEVTEATIPTADITYYAQWTEIALASYTITFDGNQGTASEENRVVVAGEAVGTLPTATRSGYTFLGWFTAATGGTSVTATTVPEANVTYYAQWQQEQQITPGPGPAPIVPVPVTPTVTTYTVTFDGNGGTASKASAEVNSGEAVGTLPTATREGYEFAGWFTEATGGTEVTAETKVSAAMTVYAQWTESTGGGGTLPEITSKKTAGKSAIIKWNKVKKATGYQIFMKTGKGDYELVKTVAASKTKFTIAGLNTGKNYKFRVTASTGKNAKKKVTYGKSVTITYKNVSGFEGYDVQMKAGKGNFETVKESAKGGTITYTVKSAKVGKKYTFRLRGYNTVNNEKTFTVL